MSRYKLIQFTNSSIGAIDANTYLPLGRVTRKLNANGDCCNTFNLSSSTSDTLYLNEEGYYKVTYSITLNAAAAGTASVTLVSNNIDTYSVSETVAAVNDLTDLTLVYIIRVCSNCCTSPNNCPLSLQFRLGDIGTSTTDAVSTSNLIVEKVF